MDLASARAKYVHAGRHRGAFIEAGIEWLRRATAGPTPIGKRTESWGEGLVITYSVVALEKTPPKELALILGDALANYRAALDHLAWEFVNRSGPPARPTQIYFPIADRLDRFEGEISRKLPGVSETVLSMVKRYQPFQNGQQYETHPLHVLDRLVNHDKHRSLHLVPMMSTALKIDIPGEYENFELSKQEHLGAVHKLLPGTDLVRIYGKVVDPTRPHGVRVHVHGMRLTLTNDEGDPMEGILDRIDAIVARILTEFAAVS